MLQELKTMPDECNRLQEAEPSPESLLDTTTIVQLRVDSLAAQNEVLPSSCLS